MRGPFGGGVVAVVVVVEVEEVLVGSASGNGCKVGSKRLEGEEVGGMEGHR